MAPAGTTLLPFGLGKGLIGVEPSQPVIGFFDRDIRHDDINFAKFLSLVCGGFQRRTTLNPEPISHFPDPSRRVPEISKAIVGCEIRCRSCQMMNVWRTLASLGGDEKAALTIHAAWNVRIDRAGVLLASENLLVDHVDRQIFSEIGDRTIPLNVGKMGEDRDLLAVRHIVIMRPRRSRLALVAAMRLAALAGGDDRTLHRLHVEMRHPTAARLPGAARQRAGLVKVNTRRLRQPTPFRLRRLIRFETFADETSRGGTKPRPDRDTPAPDEPAAHGHGARRWAEHQAGSGRSWPIVSGIGHGTTSTPLSPSGSRRGWRTLRLSTRSKRSYEQTGGLAAGLRCCAKNFLLFNHKRPNLADPNRLGSRFVG